MKKEKIEFYTGCNEDQLDTRDMSYDKYVEEEGLGETPINWEKGYDIRQELGGDIKLKNQFQSYSCCGQGWSYQYWIYQIIEMMKKYNMTLDKLRIHHKDEVDEISAKAIYSQISIGKTRGAYIRDGAKLVCNWGALFESIVPSYKEDGTTDEDFMFDKSWKSPEKDELAKILKGKNYRKIEAVDNMDLFARAILENKGIVGGVKGQNDKEWNTKYPQRPDPNKFMWGHCIWYGAFGQDEKGKFIATPNSWNLPFQQGLEWDKTKPIGYGWQQLYIDYFEGTNEVSSTNESYTFYPQFNPWTYTDLNNNNNNNMLKLSENTFYQIITGEGGFALYADSKLFVDSIEKLLSSWIIRNNVNSFDGMLKGTVGTLTWEQFQSFDHYNLKRQKIN